MTINQTQLQERLLELTQQPETSEFIYGFLDGYGFPKSTVTLLRNGSPRNVAKESGHVALRKQIYFQPITEGSVHDAADLLKSSDLIRTNAIRFVVVTDFKELVALDLRTDERMETPFNELHGNYSFFLPLAGLEKSLSHTESAADVKAAEKMGRLFELIRERNPITTPQEAHALNVFLTRLLFCFFADDTSIFKANQFKSTLESTTREDGADLSQFLSSLFAILNTQAGDKSRKAAPAHLKAFPYVNGGLFESTQHVPNFGPKSRRLLIECGTLNWSEINPDIFGSMFQAVVDDEQRSNFGQHYTSVSNIMKVIKPLLLDKLYAELEASRKNEKKLQTLLEHISKIKVFDPACGSGNFLIIAYKELRRFEMEVFCALNALGKQEVIFFTSIKLTQFYGIEIDDFAHEIARLSMWLTEHQMHKEFEAAFGHAEPMLPLKSSGNIVHGNSLRLDWNVVCPKTPEETVYVIGNPPFLGSGGRSDVQNDDMELVFSEFKKFGMLDFVASWFWKGAQYIQKSKATLALVSTNSICQGEQVAMLWPAIFGLGVNIHFAYQSFQWKNSARANAGVHVVVVGLSGNTEEKFLFKKLDGDWHAQAVKNISPYLFEAGDLAVASRTNPLNNDVLMVYGNKPVEGGHLLLTRYERDELITEAPASEIWIRKLLGADEFINGTERFCIWLENVSTSDYSDVSPVMRRINKVEKMRLESSKAQTRSLANSPGLFAEIRQPKTGSYILVPRVSSERRDYVPMGFFDSSVISSDRNSMIPDGTLFEFGVLNSLMHNDWMRAVGGRLKSDYNYSNTLVYNTFPWPETSATQRKEIEVLAEKVLMTRETYTDKSLAFLYDPDTMPHDLKANHKALDVAVERLYRARPFRNTSDRLEMLFYRYERLIALEAKQLAEQAAIKLAAKEIKKPRAPRKSVTA